MTLTDPDSEVDRLERVTAKEIVSAASPSVGYLPYPLMLSCRVAKELRRAECTQTILPGDECSVVHLGLGKQHRPDGCLF